ncbi:ThiF family adenylyltransferase [Sinomonas sp. P47F7]|uniref:ThiF family adenylyltransferase n=1 Tax=Sinomonas sp. P47F7 TaxID=3410987 RepID=UPI003BF4757E
MSASLHIPEEMMSELHSHLFPGDHDEHGAVIAASVMETSRGTRLLAHRLFLAVDGVDYVPGQYGYRMLTADFVMDCVLECAELKMAYLAAHCHGGSTSVGFSQTDMQSHERGYPALRDIVNGPPVGGLVFASDAVAGDIWFPDGHRSDLDVMVVAGYPRRILRPEPELAPAGAGEQFDRQARLFGDRGQEILKNLKVGVIGAGGAGSIIIENLVRLGVGELVVVDPDRIEPSNLPRVVGSKRGDTLPQLTHRRLGRVGKFFERFRATKVRIAKRHAREAGRTRMDALPISIMEPRAAEALVDCDHLFLAADTMQARLVFNALVHQYLIPGAQMGVKVQIDKESGAVVDMFAANRPVIPGKGCLFCNGLIDAGRLREEATDPEELRRQRYVDDDDVPAPSVITMNSVCASLATNGFLMSVTGLLDPVDFGWTKHDPRTGEFFEEEPRADESCQECSEEGRRGRGPTRRLPTFYRG